MQKRVFAAKLSELHHMLVFIQEYGRTIGFPNVTLDKVVLAAEEALVNVISYSYPSEQGGEIEIICQECTQMPGIEINIKDHGVPFDPLKKSKKVPSLDSDSALGGYGIYIYLDIMDQVAYSNTDGYNILTLVKFLQSVRSIT